MAGEQLDPQVNNLARELDTSLSLVANDPIAGDTEAQLRAASAKLGIPLDSARSVPDETLKASERASFNPSDFATRFPSTAKYLSNIDNARLSADDREPLAAVEQVVRRPRVPQDEGDTSFAGVFPRATARLGTIAESGGYLLNRLLTNIGSVFLPEPRMPADGPIDASGQARSALSQAIRNYNAIPKDNRISIAADLYNQAVEQGRQLGGVGDVVKYLVENPTAVTNLLTEEVIVGLPFALAGGATVGGLTANVGNRLLAGAAVEGVASGAATAAGTYSAEVAQRFQQNGGDLDEAVAYAATKGVVEGGVNAVFAGIGGAIPLGSTFGQRAAAVGGRVAAQAAGGAAGAAAAAAAVGEQASPGELLLEGLLEGVGAPIDLAVAATVSVQERQAQRQAQAEEATVNADQLGELLTAAAASQTRLRDPQTFAQLVQQAAEDAGSAPTELFIDAQPLVQILEQAGVTPEQLATMLPSVAEQIDEALATDGTVTIPVGEAVTAFAGSGVEQELVRNARTTADAISVADAEAAAATTEALSEEAQQIIAEQQEREAWDTSAQQVFDQMTADLNTAGRFTPDVNKAYATIVRDFFTVQAGKLGTMPDQLFSRYRIRVGAQQRGGAVLNQPTEISAEISAEASANQAERAAAAGSERSEISATRALPETIEIDGVQRSTRNSNGKPIAFTEEGLRDFWAWFGDSKVVDAEGRPLVVYRGGPTENWRDGSQIDAFDSPNGPWAGFFTSSPEVASRFAEAQLPMTMRGGSPAGVFPAYLSLQDPLVVDAAGAPAREFQIDASVIGKTDSPIREQMLSGGYDGLLLSNTADEADVFVALDPTQIKSATGNSGAFDPANPSIVMQDQADQGGARATFNPATLEINLLEKADLSSFLHELGHAFLEIQATIAAQPDAPAAITQDMQTVFDAVGYTGTAQDWIRLPVSERRIAHETVAESFEQYLFEGKAPTLEQQALFAKLRSWMIAVYRTLTEFLSTNGNAKLTDEVRGVFDRMLATDEAIAAAKAARAATPLFTSAEQAGMTPEQFADYQRAVGEVDEEAVRELDARSLRDMKWLRSARDRTIKAMQKEAAEKRRNARIEARRQLLNEPVYRAMLFLRGKVDTVKPEPKSKGLDARRDDLTTAIAKLGGLNREQAVSQFGIDPADFPTKIVGSPVLRAGKAGRSPDAMAEVLAEAGYLMPREGGRYDLRDLEDMLHDQARGVPHYSMAADYDLINGYQMIPVPEDARDNAFAAGRLSRPELAERFANSNLPWENLGVGRRGMIAEIGMPMDAVAEITGFKTGEEMVTALLNAEPLQSATEGLTDQIMLERWGDLSSPEAIAAAADAALANEARARMVATEFARLNTAVGSPRIVQTAARQTAAQVVARQKVRNVRPDKSAAAAARAGKGAEQAFKKGDSTTAAGFKRSQVLNSAIEREQRSVRTEIEKARDNFAKVFGNDKRMAKSRDMNMVNAAREILSRYGLAPEVAGQRAQDYQEVLRRENPGMADQLEAISGMLPEAKDYRELTVEEFRGMRDAVLGMFQLSRRVMQTRIDGKLVEQDEVASQIVEAVIAANNGELPGLLGYDRTITDAQKLKVGLMGFVAGGRRVEQWTDSMGGGMKNVIFQQVSDAAVQARIKRNEMIAKYREILRLAEPGMSYAPINAPELGGGFVFSRGKQELLHAILHTGNPSNLRKLLIGRKWATTDAEGNLDTTAWDNFVSRMIDEGVLTKADYDFAQGVWDLLETVKLDAQRAHFDIYGFYFNEVTAAPIQTPFGEYRGGYVPALVTALSAADQAQKREAEAAQQNSNSYMFPTTGKGFTQSRVDYNKPLELDLRTIGSHLDKVARFAFLEPAIHDTARLLQNKRVARALNGLDTNIISKMLTPWLQRAATQTTTNPGKYQLADKFFRGIRTRAGMYIMFANIVNTLQQVTGFSVAALKVPAPRLLRAVRAYVGNPGEMARMASEMSPWLRDRLDRQGYEMTQQIEEILANPNVFQKANDFMKRNAYFMQTGLQNVMDVVVWWGAYEHARAQGANERDAVRYGDEAVRTTQGTYSPEDVSEIEINTPFVQMFTQFWGYFNMLANTLGTEAKKAVREMGYMASTPRLLFIWFAGLMLPAVVAQIIAQGLPDDEDDEDGDGTLDEWMAMFFGSQASTLAAMVPGVGQAATLFANQLDSKIYNDRLNISPALSLFESGAKGLASIVQGEAFDDRLQKAEVRNVAIAVALATGMPTNVIAKPLGYQLDVEAGKKDPENAAEYAIGLTTGR
jgi:hypothetical protein